jgi:hypothetical protein
MSRLRKSNTINITEFRLVPPYRPFPFSRTDAFTTACIFSFALFAYSASLTFFGDMPARMAIGGMWFQSDAWRVFDDMTKFDANHYRDNVHPLFSITFIPLTNLLKVATGWRFIDIIFLVNAIFYASLCSMIYATSRLIGCRAIDAVMLAALAGVSAGSIYWFLVPESYPIASLSVILPILVVAFSPNRDWPYVLASAASLSYTVSNWTIGLWAALIGRKLWRAAYVTALGLLIVLCGWGVAKLVLPYPGALFLLPKSLMGETAYMLHGDSGSLWDKLGGELLSSIVAPDVKYIYNQPTGTMLSVQAQIGDTLRSGEPAYLIGVVAVAGLFAMSFYAYLSRRDAVTHTIMLGLLSQVAVNLLYGEETMLYALHFVPLIVPLFAISLASQARLYARFLLMVLIAAAAYNNLRKMEAITALPFTGTSEYLYRLAL